MKQKQFLTVVLCLLCGTSIVTSAQTVEEKIQSALNMEYRTAAEKARDANRAPVEALKFMGLKDDMKVSIAPARGAAAKK